jgi:hypothetical protein
MSIAMNGTIFVCFKDLLAHLYRGQVGNTLSNFLQELATGDFAVLQGPIMEDEEKKNMLFCNSALQLDTEDLDTIRALNIPLGSLLKARGIARCIVRLTGE